jgi:hypothetical protein
VLHLWPRAFWNFMQKRLVTHRAGVMSCKRLRIILITVEFGVIKISAQFTNSPFCFRKFTSLQLLDSLILVVKGHCNYWIVLYWLWKGKWPSI